jgi:hypothetical protein
MKMASIDILVGPSLAHRTVEATMFLPGLVLHKTPDAPGQDLYSVTHRVSGLAILTHVAEQHLAAVRRMLGDACWTLMPDDIFEGQEYYRLIRTVLQVIHGRDVLHGTDDENRRRGDPGSNWGFFATVATPSIHAEELVAAGTEALVLYTDLQQVQARGDARNRVPVLMVGVGNREDVVVIPRVALPHGFLADLRTVVVDATLRGYLSVTASMADRAVRGHCFRVSFGKEQFVLMGYVPFLRFAKRGLL